MQSDATEHGHSEQTVDSAILDALKSGSLTAAELKQRVRTLEIRGFADKQYKAFLDALVGAQRIHGVPKLNKSGKPAKTIERYALGPPPPPPPPPRERAVEVILLSLRASSLSADELKRDVKASVPGLAEAEYKSILKELTEARQIYGRRKWGKNGKPTKAIERYLLGGPPADEFIAPVLIQWREARNAAVAAGVQEQALVAALLDGLGISTTRLDATQTSSDDREQVLRGLRDLIAREGQGSLISIRKLRAALPLPKSRFDAAILELYAKDVLILHHHDYVGNLSEAERNDLVLDRHGNYYVGVALRGEA